MPDDTPPRNREDLERLIAGAILRNITFFDERKALATADTVLREMRAAGLKISRRRPPGSGRLGG